MASRRTWAQASIWALLCLMWVPAAFGRDALISPKERATSINVGDEAYTPGTGFPLGPFRLHPFLRQRLDFDDNVFLEESDATWAFFYAATGGMRADLLPGNHEFTAGYKARGTARLLGGGGPDVSGAAQDVYADRVDALTRLEHVVDLRNALNFSWGRFDLVGGWEKLSDPLNFATTSRIGRQVWSGGLRGEAEFARLRFGAGGTVRRYEFEGVFAYLDDLQIGATAEVGYMVASKLNLGLEYGWSRIQYGSLSAQEVALYGDHDDVDVHALTAGLKGSPTARIDLVLMLGFSMQRVTGSSGEGGASFFGRVRVRWAATQALSLEGAYIRDVQISQLASFQEVDRLEGKAGYRFNPFVFGKIFTYVENTSPSRGDGFLRYGIGVQAEYRMTAWLSTGMGYEFRGRTTSIPDADFSNHRAWIHLTVGF